MARVAYPRVSSSPWTDLDRPPLRAEELRRGLAGSRWSDVQVVASTGSTNADVAAAARAGAGEGLVLVTEWQRAGRGRLGRSWSAPPRSGLTFSVLLRPAVPPSRLGWIPLLAGVAVASALGRVADVDLRLKWPNDVLAGEHKLAGILAERVEEAVVLGVGINVTLRRDELPTAGATSLALEGAVALDRDTLLRAVLRELDTRYADFVGTGGDPDAAGLRDAYRRNSATLGRDVRVQLPGEVTLTGRAGDVDAEGRLVLTGPHGLTAVAAGDVVHVRRA